jgi:CO/xanthine dehydrogenase FAD-binding subunit
MKHFQYYEPETIEDVCLLLSKVGKEASILAGGTDLIVQMRKGFLAPEHIINIKKIRGLDFIREDAKGYRFGVLATIADIAAHSGLQQSFPIIASSAKSIGSAQIRNLATLGGNLCNASPSADMSPSLLVLEANVMVVGLQDSRMMPIADFFVGPGRVDLAKEEMLVEVIVPFPPENTKMIYYKLGPRKAMDCAVVSVAVAISLNEITGECEKARIALGAVAPTPVRVREAEKLVEGKVVEEIPLSKIAETVRQRIAPITDVRGSEEYRSETATTLTIRAINTLMNLSS